MSKFDEKKAILTQVTDIVDNINIAASAAISNAIRTNGFRGLAVIVPNEWTAADIGFYGVYGEQNIPLRGTDGTKVVISGIQTAEQNIYIAPASVWALGAFDRFYLASLDTGTGALTNQAANRVLKVAILR